MILFFQLIFFFAETEHSLSVNEQHFTEPPIALWWHLEFHSFRLLVIDLRVECFCTKSVTIHDFSIKQLLMRLFILVKWDQFTGHRLTDWSMWKYVTKCQWNWYFNKSKSFLNEFHEKYEFDSSWLYVNQLLSIH